MKITDQTISACRGRFTAEASPEEVRAEWTAVLQEIAPTVRLEGFRPGRAPLDVVYARFKPHVDRLIRQRLTQRILRQIHEQTQRRVYELVDVHFNELSKLPDQFEATLTVDLWPEFTLPDYKHLPLQMQVPSVTDEQVQQVLTQLRERNARYEDAPEGHAVAETDLVQVDAEGRVDGQPIEERAPRARGIGRMVRAWLQVGPGPFPRDLARALIGAAVGEPRRVRVSFPADFSIPELAGLDADYDVTVRGIRVRTLPPLDDAFAQQHGEDSLEQLRQKVYQSLLEASRRQARETLFAQVLDLSLNQTQMDLPETAWAEELRTEVADVVMSRLQKGETEEQVRADKVAIEQEAAQRSQRRLRAMFLLRRLAEAEQIEVTQDELKSRVREAVADYVHRAGQEPDKDTVERMASAIYSSLLYEKVRERIAQYYEPNSSESPTAVAS